MHSKRSAEPMEIDARKVTDDSFITPRNSEMYTSLPKGVNKTPGILRSLGNTAFRSVTAFPSAVTGIGLNTPGKSGILMNVGRGAANSLGGWLTDNRAQMQRGNALLTNLDSYKNPLRYARANIGKSFTPISTAWNEVSPGWKHPFDTFAKYVDDPGYTA